MITRHQPPQTALEFVSLEELVPEDHLLRKVAQTIDFDFIHDRVRHLYSETTGRPSLPPVTLFKLLILGYLFGIRSERQLMREVQVNAAYRWFLGLGLRDKVPDASTLSQNRRRRFSDGVVHQEIFDQIVVQAMNAGLVGGDVLYTDSTHLKADANKQKHKTKRVAKETKRYLAELEVAIQRDRKAHGRKPLPDSDKKPETVDRKISTTDPESGYMMREGKPKGFFYLDHRTVDGLCNIITDSHVTPSTVVDSVPYLDRLDHQIARFGFEVDAVGLDAGYHTAAICQGLLEREIKGVVGYRRPRRANGMFAKRQYEYDRLSDAYRCPAGKRLAYRTTTREGLREYASRASACSQCPLLSQCTKSKDHVKVVTRHVWQDAKETMDAHRSTEWGQAVYRRRKETVERSFADAKQLHGHRYARYRGLAKVQAQALLAAAAQNIKKMALKLWKGGRPLPRPQHAQWGFWATQDRLLWAA